jgi:hypothetical protein
VHENGAMDQIRDTDLLGEGSSGSPHESYLTIASVFEPVWGSGLNDVVSSRQHRRYLTWIAGQIG